ncbi:E3 ubiquitin-protein ligase TRIM39-like [Carassius auratus]|uniref:E3 ubiquitin-protein ligase TRIM39-like n=1 Tax=Carassius auratus TaxID=7957 RepID=A0A6P6IYI9_CARAU|nr:E3 ubiquitin-protein ligase TRIM39-like [Carassius auratus]
MASRSSFEEDLSCPVCCDLFINPVVLSCSHSVCEDCVHRFWKDKRRKECPVCRRSSKERPPVNLALKNLCETYQQHLSRGPSSGDEGVCGLHKEKLKLFCLDDQEPVCLVCRDSRKHTNHRFSPVDEAVMDNKEILKDALQHLVKKRGIFESFKECFDERDELVKFNAQHAERRIKAEFEELHRFLRDEEAIRITALREEEERRSRMMRDKIEETSRQISSLSQTIRDTEEQMKHDDVSFLQNFNSTLQRALCNPPLPEAFPEVTIRFSSHLTNLKLTVLQKMQDTLGESSYYFKPSPIQSDLAAIEISDNQEEYNEYERFQMDGGNCTKIFGGRRSNGDRQQFPDPLARATDLFPAPVSTTEPTFNLPMIHRGPPVSQILRSQIMTRMNYGEKLVVGRPRLKSRFRRTSVPSPLDLAFGASTNASRGGNPQGDLKFLTFRGGDFSLQDMVICDHEILYFCPVLTASVNIAFRGFGKNKDIKLVHSRKHTNHRFCPIDEALTDNKAQAQCTEKLIKEEFEKLHQLLRDEEAIRITALREEEKQKSQKMIDRIEETSKQIVYLTRSIRDTQEQMKAGEDSFLRDLKDSLKRGRHGLSDPENVSETLIDVPKHLKNLKFTVLQKMQEDIKYTPVTLDPSTAHSNLTVSDDLTSVRFRDEEKLLPDNPERFDSWECVLASEGFDSGLHCWDVEVGDLTNWTFGVMTESARRKGDILTEKGLWVLGYASGEYYAFITPEQSPPLTVKNKLQKIRVQLNYEKGKLSFIDPLSNTSIHTFTQKFTEKVYPWFGLRCDVCPLVILPVN